MMDKETEIKNEMYNDLSEERKKQRIECLNKAIGKRNYLELLIKKIQKEYEEARESVKIWRKRKD